MRNLLAFVFVWVLLIQPVHGSGQWMSEYRFKSHYKNMTRKKMRATSVSCRKSGKGALKAEIKANWVPDDGKRQWVLYIFRGDLDWKPGKPENWNKWKKKSYTLLKGRGGAKLRCVLYERK